MTLTEKGTIGCDLCGRHSPRLYEVSVDGRKLLACLPCKKARKQ